MASHTLNIPTKIVPVPIYTHTYMHTYGQLTNVHICIHTHIHTYMSSHLHMCLDIYACEYVTEYTDTLMSIVSHCVLSMIIFYCCKAAGLPATRASANEHHASFCWTAMSSSMLLYSTDVLYSLHNRLTLLQKYTSTRSLDRVNQISVTQSRVIPSV